MLVYIPLPSHSIIFGGSSAAGFQTESSGSLVGSGMGVSPPTAGMGGNRGAGMGCGKDWGAVRGRPVLLYRQYAITHGLGTLTLRRTNNQSARSISTVHHVVAHARHCIQQLPGPLPTSLCKSVGQRFLHSSRCEPSADRE